MLREIDGAVGASRDGVRLVEPAGERGDRPVRPDALHAVVERVGDVHDAVGRDRQAVGPVEPRVVGDGPGRCVTARHASEQLGDEEISGRVVRQGRGLLELGDGADRPSRIDMPDPSLVMDDPEAAARIDGDLDREAEGSGDRRAPVTRAAASAVAGKEAQTATGEPEDAVEESETSSEPAGSTTTS